MCQNVHMWNVPRLCAALSKQEYSLMSWKADCCRVQVLDAQWRELQRSHSINKSDSNGQDGRVGRATVQEIAVHLAGREIYGFLSIL